ncbi:MAG TPA: CDP-alcohol phosphatidyltransferase family protein [Pyrinomonadaceae bacterium]|jgi:phosphatidylcholine synthase
MKREVILAWGVHLYTAMGLVAAAWMAVLIVRGGDASFRSALVLMIAATVIDSTDGWLARRARVKEHVPGFDGRRLDDLVDFLTYTCLPLLLIWRAEILPAEQAGWLLLPLLASAYGFSQVDAKTDDGFFLGFPSYWNMVAIYLYLLRPSAVVSLALIIVLSVLTFVPWRYVYPSQRTPFSRLTNWLAAVWALLLLVILSRPPDDSKPIILLSLAFPVYYLLLSWAITLHRRVKSKREI